MPKQADTYQYDMYQPVSLLHPYTILQPTPLLYLSEICLPVQPP